MKPYTTLLAGLLLAVLASSTLSARINGIVGTPEKGYLRPFVFYAEPAESRISGDVGGGIASGVYLGALEEHDASFEWSSVQLSQRETAPGIAVRARTNLMPILFSYRFRFGTPSWTFRPYLSTALGWTHTRLTVSGTVAEIDSFRDRKKSWDFTWSGGAGVSVAATERLDLDIGYRYLDASGDSYSIGETTFRNIRDSRAHIGYAGIAIRF